MSVTNINGCHFGCDCESCSGWLLAPEQRAIAEWLGSSVPYQETIVTDVSIWDARVAEVAEIGYMSRFQGPSTK